MAEVSKGVTKIRVLLVDDFAAFRRLVCWIFNEKPELQVVGEAVNGLEAVHKSEVLQPDLVVLDVSLPLLNGIEAARQICRLSPKSKIVFFSVNSSPDIARIALESGGTAFVAKSDATRDLLTAIDAVLLGERFVSESLAKCGLI